MDASYWALLTSALSSGGVLGLSLVLLLGFYAYVAWTKSPPLTRKQHGWFLFAIVVLAFSSQGGFWWFEQAKVRAEEKRVQAEQDAAKAKFDAEQKLLNSQYHVVVEMILQPAGGPVVDEFDFRYRRPGGTSATKRTTNAEVSIDDLERGSETLEVVYFSHPKYEIVTEAVKGIWTFPITEVSEGRSGSVLIPVKDKYEPPKDPSQESMIKRLDNAGITKEAVEAPTLTLEEKENVTLTLLNMSGQKIELWAYDCWHCFNQRDAGSLTGSSYMDLLRFDSIEKTPKTFDRFETLKSTSGIFGLFVKHAVGGHPDAQFVGFFNLYNPTSQEGAIRRDEGAENPFYIESITPAQGQKP